VKLRLTTPQPPAPNGCPNDNIIDSVLVPKQVKVTINNDSNCFGSPKTLTANGEGGVPLGTQYRWVFYSGSMTSTTVVKPVPYNPNNLDPTLTVNPANVGTHFYKVVIGDLNGCKDSTAFSVQTLPLPLRELPPKVRVCTGVDTVLDAGNSNGSVSTWRWMKTPANPTLADSTLQRIVPNDSATYIVTKIDQFGCRIKDSTRFYRNPPPPIDAGPDRNICFHDPLTLVRATGTNAYIDSYQWFQVIPGSPDSLLSDRDSIMVSPLVTTDYKAVGTITYDNVTCSDTDGMTMVVKELPSFAHPQPIPICRNSHLVSMPLINVTNKTNITTSIWSYRLNPAAVPVQNGVPSNQVNVDSLKWLPPPTGTTPYGNYITITVNDSDGCHMSDSLLLGVFPVPNVTAGKTQKFCDIDPVYAISPASTKQAYFPYDQGAVASNEEWYGNGIFLSDPTNNRFSFNPKAADVKVMPDTNIITYLYTGNKFPGNNAVTFNPPKPGITMVGPFGGCPASDTVIFRVIQSPVLHAGIQNPVCKSADTVDFMLNSQGTATTTAKNPQTSYWFFAAVDASGASQVPYRPAIYKGQKFIPRSPVIPDLTHTYRIVFGDTATGCRIYDTTSIKVNANPPVDIDYATTPLDSAVCQTKGSVNFYINPTGYSRPDVDMYSVPALPVGVFNVSTGSMDITDPAIGNQLYKIFYYFKDPGTGCYNTDSVNIRVQLPPQIDIEDGHPVCDYAQPFSVALNKYPPLPYHWVWATDDATWSDPSTTGITYTLTASDKARGIVHLKAIVTDTGVCNSVSDEADFTVNAQPYAEFNCLTCQGCVDARKNLALNATFQSQDTKVPTPAYHWYIDGSEASATPFTDSVFVKSYTTGGKHLVQLFVESNSCWDTSHVDTVIANPTPVADFFTNPFTTTVANPYFDFINNSTIDKGSSMTYMWYLGMDPVNNTQRFSTETNPHHVPFAADTMRVPISLVVTSDKGCTDSVGKFIRIDPDITVFIPSVFYPGSAVDRPDCPYGCNKTFKVAAQGFETIEIFVFNRWGQMVFKTTNPNEGWNGYPFNETTRDRCEQDAYIYQVNATSFSGKKYTYSGSITLLW
jgi:hypothetical protein